jgi:hypothetical protein
MLGGIHILRRRSPVAVTSFCLTATVGDTLRITQ